MPSVTDKDRGYRKLLASIEASKSGFKITLGIHAEEGSAADGNATVVQVAEWNEFGTETIPARPAITGWADERGDDAIREVSDDMARALKAGVSPIQRADQLAQKFAAEIQAKISGHVPPPNAQSTIDRKGSSTPLINTGQFRSSIRGKVKAK